VIKRTTTSENEKERYGGVSYRDEVFICLRDAGKILTRETRSLFVLEMPGKSSPELSCSSYGNRGSTPDEKDRLTRELLGGDWMQHSETS
jgi:hypothetical protein